MNEKPTGRIYVPLARDEAHALLLLAEIEHREPREQARFIIWRELKRRGLLAKDQNPAAGGGKHVLQ